MEGQTTETMEQEVSVDLPLEGENNSTSTQEGSSISENPETTTEAVAAATQAAAAAMEKVKRIELNSLTDVLSAVSQTLEEVRTLAAEMRMIVQEIRTVQDQTVDSYEEALEIVAALEPEDVESTNSEANEPTVENAETIVRQTKKSLKKTLRKVL